MRAETKKDNDIYRLRFRDILVILICLSGAVYSLNLFRLDLFHTINSRNEAPIGTIIIKNNIVQRRIADRILWDRLVVTSPVYLGDLIHVADLSAAILNIDDNSVSLSENTLIRIQRARNTEGSYVIELNEGNLNLSAGGEGGNIKLNLNQLEIEARPGTVLNAATGQDGLVLAVSEGTVVFVREGQTRELPSGTMITLDSGGMEQREPAAVVTQPNFNARYLKSNPEPLPISFAWSRMNLDAADVLRLEIAPDRNFSRLFRVIENLNNQAEAALPEGHWYWRLCY